MGLFTPMPAARLIQVVINRPIDMLKRQKRQVLALTFASSLILSACSGEKETSSPPSPSATPASSHDSNYGNTTSAPIEAEVTLVMVGDSITAGFGLPADQALPVRLQTALQKTGHAINIINAGVSGDTTGDALDRFDWSIGGDIDGVLIALGGNDLLQGIDPDKTYDNLDQMISRAKVRGVTVILAGMRAPGNYGRAYQKNFDAIYPALAQKHKIALYPFLLEGVGANPSLNQPDGIHPNPRGVKLIVDGLAPFLRETIGRETIGRETIGRETIGDINSHHAQ